MLKTIDTKTAAINIAKENVVMVDIRSPSSWLKGVPQQAKLWSEQQLIDQAQTLRSQDKLIYIICYRGQTSSNLVNQLIKKYGSGFYSVEGGFEAWKTLGLPIDTPRLSSLPTQSRYERQIKLHGFGEVSQQKLFDAHVLVVGAGGLGAPALLYLAGAGIGKITLMDDDVIELHNLHRQIIYQQHEVGLKKSAVAKTRLQGLNDSIEVKAIDQKLSADNVMSSLSGVDLVIDGTDNVNTRYLINKACLKQHTPWVFAAVSGFSIQIALFKSDRSQPCYRCLFPEMEGENIPNCGNEGILGFVPGLAGLLQVTEGIKFLTQIGKSLEFGMLNYDVLNHQFKVLKYPPIASGSCQH